MKDENEETKAILALELPELHDIVQAAERIASAQQMGSHPPQREAYINALKDFLRDEARARNVEDMVGWSYYMTIIGVLSVGLAALEDETILEREMSLGELLVLMGKAARECGAKEFFPDTNQYFISGVCYGAGYWNNVPRQLIDECGKSASIAVEKAYRRNAVSEIGVNKYLAEGEGLALLLEKVCSDEDIAPMISYVHTANKIVDDNCDASGKSTYASFQKMSQDAFDKIKHLPPLVGHACLVGATFAALRFLVAIGSLDRSGADRTLAAMSRLFELIGSEKALTIVSLIEATSKVCSAYRSSGK